MLDGTVGSMEVTYKYRTRKEFAEFTDAMMAAARAANEADESEDFSVTKMYAKTSASNIDWVMEAVEGWNLDIPFDKEAVTQLDDELPAAMAAIIDTYRVAISEGRLGN